MGSGSGRALLPLSSVGLAVGCPPDTWHGHTEAELRKSVLEVRLAGIGKGGREGLERPIDDMQWRASSSAAMPSYIGYWSCSGTNTLNSKVEKAPDSPNSTAIFISLHLEQVRLLFGRNFSVLLSFLNSF